MSLTREDVEKIALLARLEITEEEMSGFVKNLSSILDFVDLLSAAPVENVTPMAHPLEDMHQRLRSDTITESDERARFQANAPATEAGLYLVPRVIE